MSGRWSGPALFCVWAFCRPELKVLWGHPNGRSFGEAESASRTDVQRASSCQATSEGPEGCMHELAVSEAVNKQLLHPKRMHFLTGGDWVLYETFYITFPLWRLLSLTSVIEKKSPCNLRSVWRKRHLWKPEARREGEVIQSDPKRPLRKSGCSVLAPSFLCPVQ